VFVNAPRTLRQGAELTWDSRWSANWKSLVSMAWVDATYDSAFNTQKYDAKTKLPVLDKSIAAGNHLPGIPAQQLFASLQWAQQGFAQTSRRGPGGLLVSADWVARSGLWASDINDAGSRVDGYGVLNVRARYKFDWGPAQMETWAGVENLMDRRYVGSVIVNQSAADPQYFEPGLPRNAMVGVKLSLPL
jgi:iron complex outermembrane receptor protein